MVLRTFASCFQAYDKQANVETGPYWSSVGLDMGRMFRGHSTGSRWRPPSTFDLISQSHMGRWQNGTPAINTSLALDLCTVYVYVLPGHKHKVAHIYKVVGHQMSETECLVFICAGCCIATRPSKHPSARLHAEHAKDKYQFCIQFS